MTFWICFSLCFAYQRRALARWSAGSLYGIGCTVVKDFVNITRIYVLDLKDSLLPKVHMRILGIDPGAGGALVLLDTKTNQLTVLDMPTVEIKRGQRMVNQVSAQLVAELLRGHKIDHAVMEKVHAMPGQGVSSMFAFGRAAGVVEGVLSGLSLPTTLVPPQEWQKAMRVIGGKDGSRHRAMELFPEQAPMFARKKDDGRADAALIAAYGAKLCS